MSNKMVVYDLSRWRAIRGGSPHSGVNCSFVAWPSLGCRFQHLNHAERTHSMNASAAQPNPAHLVLIFTDQMGRRGVVLDNIYYSVGRAVNNHIRLYDPCVSRKHALIIRIPDENRVGYGYVVFDGGSGSGRSTNGLFVNGKRVLSHRLELLDKIGFGPNVTAIVESTDRLTPETLAGLLKPLSPGDHRALLGSQKKTSEEIPKKNGDFTAA
ncbi:FHA domain-containing protein [Synechococcus sp. R55.3]|jgi:pSer/pThr/pTyr-binding forkhead associated (FHA) protein|uniref:FHA domain-containing protein n=2 Tax=unclassified Synechococcus TaxID=2626047 RepID=UPI0039C09882